MKSIIVKIETETSFSNNPDMPDILGELKDIAIGLQHDEQKRLRKCINIIENN